MILSITWDVDPELFNIFGREIRWYGLLWATALLSTAWIVKKMYKNENLPEAWFEKLFLWVAIGLIIGARLGHCLFYEPIYYLSHPLKLLAVWEGGLASHGGAIGMTIAVCLYSLSITKQKLNWKHLLISSGIGLLLGFITYFLFKNFIYPDVTIGLLGFGLFGVLIGICISMIYTTREMTIKVLDKLVVGVALGAMFIRLGNLFNHEIYGGATDMPWGFRFIANISEWKAGAEAIYTAPSHPTQLYEALTYLVIFIIGMFLYWKTDANKKHGLILGISLIGIFLSRFFIEFIKYVQEDFEILMRETIGIDMGQLLSLPFIIWGIFLIWNALSKKNSLPKEKEVNK